MQSFGNSGVAYSEGVMNTFSFSYHHHQMDPDEQALRYWELPPTSPHTTQCNLQIEDDYLASLHSTIHSDM